MKYYPVNLDVRNKNCVVVGGGAVGTRKVTTLLDCGARVTVISPEITPRLQALFDEKRIEIQKRAYQRSDLSDTFLVIGATDDEALNRQIHADAEKQNMLCNIADRPKSCNFILPSIIQRGDLVVTVSTSGKSPAYAKKMRQDLEGLFGEEHALFLQLMGSIREKLLKEDHEPEFHKPIFEKLIHSGLVKKIKHNDIAGINACLRDILGSGYAFEALMAENKNDA